MHRFNKKITGWRLFKARRTIEMVKQETAKSLKHEIETGIETLCLKNKGDKITRKITWWRLKNPAQVVRHWILHRILIKSN